MSISLTDHIVDYERDVGTPSRSQELLNIADSVFIPGSAVTYFKRNREEKDNPSVEPKLWYQTMISLSAGADIIKGIGAVGFDIFYFQDLKLSIAYTSAFAVSAAARHIIEKK